MVATTSIRSQDAENSIPILVLKNRNDITYEQENKGVFTNADILTKFFWGFLSDGDKSSLFNLSIVNKYHYTIFTQFAQQKIPLPRFFEMLMRRCRNLTILDPEAFQKTSALPILCSNFDFINHIDKEAGATVFYYEERTIEELTVWGEGLGVEINARGYIQNTDSWQPKESPQICIVTNRIFKNTHVMMFDKLRAYVENERGCQMLTARRAVYFALRMLSMPRNATIVYGPEQAAYTFTLITGITENPFLVIGIETPQGNSTFIRFMMTNWGYGAGGHLKFLTH